MDRLTRVTYRKKNPFHRWHFSVFSLIELNFKFNTFIFKLNGRRFPTFNMIRLGGGGGGHGRKISWTVLF